MRKLIPILSIILLSFSPVNADLVTNGNFVNISVSGIELHVDGNATTDPNANEADAVTGWNNAFLNGTGANVFESQGGTVNVGTYAFHANCNDTPTASARFLRDVETDWGLTAGVFYRITLDGRHVGTGGRWAMRFDSGQDLTPAQPEIARIDTTDTTFSSYTAYLNYTAVSKWVGAREINGTNDGGVFIDNISMRTMVLDSWTSGAGWYPYADGTTGVFDEQAYCYNAATALEQAVTPITGAVYKISYTIANYSGTDAIAMELGGTAGTARSANGTYVEQLTATNAGNLKFTGDVDIICTIDTVSVIYISGGVLLIPQ